MSIFDPLKTFTRTYELFYCTPCMGQTEAGDIRDLLATDADANGKRGGLSKPLDLYWTDAAEREGVVYLYGLVRAPADEEGEPEYQSCCVAVTNNQRSLFVLPRIRPGALPLSAYINWNLSTDHQSLLQERLPAGPSATVSATSARRSIVY